MRAVTYSAFGDAVKVLHLQDLPPVPPGPGEVTVELAFSGVNPSDIKARAGTRPGVTEPPFPLIIPHSDGSGVITAVGDSVPASRIGQRVWVWNGQWQRAFGTAASHITLPSAQAVELPDSVSFETGAVLGIPGLTACHAVFSGGTPKGHTILIHGGAGTVGYLAVQLAKWAGARVIATASRRNFDRVKSAGADVVLDYNSPDLADQILGANDGRTISRVIDVEFGANIETNTAVIAENGRINAYGSAQNMAPVFPFGPMMFKAVTLEMILIYLLPANLRSAAIETLHNALTEGALTCPVQRVFTLEDCAAAHDMVQDGNRVGAVLVATK
ncbi:MULTISPECIES: NADPH:quinone reductase [unclassified Ruegeria]|uniref:NADPH:quinone reductase n=1 Tax=unclassified Ruegeria TaxID=2625375 RepID=UPI0014898727|nr:MULTISPECIES: NADPH:quinone reductase [unclassified Ruegeria]NOD74592.1 zinc-binding dehydrogenase [Ruegeria sp. HKCCD4332]NOD88675.1 zinc-binding dehydrogenase [Ruegeria sp. HKCCD4318]NOE12097.1 zinc-binding dehydrogenase [Ruegeria sp. HKCCD4318-2]NOG09739.1 NADPH:quinone reductase [Ruegeria sp. HKCCD4315]